MSRFDDARSLERELAHERLSRRDFIRRAAALGLSAPAMAAILAACGPGATPTTAPAAPGAAPTATRAPAGAPAGATAPAQPAQTGERPKRGGTLRAVVQNDFVTMWPTVTTGPTAYQCYDWLVRWRKGADGRWGPEPGLAESWDLGERSAVFKLRRGVKFHDGSDLNAEAVRWNVETWIKHPKSLATTSLEAVATDNPAEVVDEHTVKINLTGAAGSLLSALSDVNQNTGIASKAAYERLGDDGLGLQAVGTGPFVFEQWQSGSQFVVNRNPNYWEKGADGNALPYLDKIIYRFVPDDSVRLVEMRSGNADITDLVRGRDVPSVKGDPNLVYAEDPGIGNRYRFFFNGNKGPFKDNLKLRQAVQYAIDREAIARALGGGIGIPQRYDLTPGVIGYDESLPYYSFDLDKAKQLRAESGAPAGLPIRLTVITREADQQQAQLLQQMLDRIDIKVQIEALERVAWGQKVRRENDFDMATQRTSSPVDPDTLALSWAKEGPAAYIRADVPQVEQCFAEGRSTYDQQQRHEIYKRCQTLWYETAWWGFIWLQPWNYLFSKRLKNVPPMYASTWREEVFWLDG